MEHISYSTAVDILEPLGMLPILNPGPCRGYVYVFIDVTNWRAGNSPHLYLGGNELPEDGDPMLDG